MRLTQLRDLLAIVDSGSFRAASRALGVHAPGLTRSVRELEKEMGVQLFERTAHGIVPTTAGKAIINRARTVQSELGRMKEDSAQLAGDGGMVTFGAGSTASMILPAAVTAFRRAYPSTELRIISSVGPTLHSHLRDGRLEFLLGALPGGRRADKQIKAYPLYRNEWTIVGRRGHPLAKAKSLQELLNADWLTYGALEEPAGTPRSWFADLFAANGLAPPRSVVRSEGRAFLNLLVHTDLIGIQSKPNYLADVVRDQIEPFQVKMRKPASTMFTTHLIVRADSQLTPAAAAMVAAIKAEARKLAFAKAPGK